MSDEHPNVRRALGEFRKWIHESDDKPRTPERNRWLDEQARKAAIRHDLSDRSDVRAD